MDHSNSYASADLSKVVDLATLCTCTFLTIGWTSSGWMAGTTVTTTLLQRHFGICLQFSLNLCVCPSHCLDLIKGFFSFKLFIIVDWGFWASTLLVHARTCSLVTSLISSVLLSSHIISTSISLSFNLCIIYSFYCLFLYNCILQLLI